MIRPSLANNIISEVRNLIDEDLIVVDTNGIIIASTDENRIGTFHEGALTCYSERNKIIITKEDQRKLTGVKAGINLPIFFQKQIIGVIGITGEPSKVSPYGELLKKMTELLIKESYYSEQLEWHSRTLEAFVFDWIQQKEWSTSFLNQSTLLDVNLSIDRQIIIGHYSRTEDDFNQRKIWNDIIQTIVHDKNDIFVRWGNERFVLLRTRKGNEKRQSMLHFIEQLQRYLKEKYNKTLSFGIGQMVSSREIYRSFEQADRALAVAIRTQSIVFEDELRLEMCLQDIKKHTRNEFVHRTIAPIIKDIELMNTIRAFIVHNQSFKETASALHIHINTLHYRLKKIENVTELNPREFHDMATLYLAVTFLDDHLKNQG
ncbi:carbohydrate diacid regulator [Salipaludibacillus neizhouensis]|uniref:Carbohydrate diacid regulator n=1 Tax=Salipaludibacillus neizhouensis TaxID=885475 RepID=A0A3A9K5F2_9BACI|nr:sugar diacid recognition domain-containing protein [Salipaludibacillus neizhouensis]RKL66598.1 carbohydrate diacid regulator [Salipaludibacillus neizhouensis]